MTKRTIPAGDILPAKLLNRLRSNASKYGGLMIRGEEQSPAIGLKDKENRTQLVLSESDIEGDVSTFIAEYETTDASYFYQINVVPE